VIHGKNPFNSREEHDRRLAICQDCDKFDSTQGRCSVCGCRGGLKSWISSESGRCPLGKWQ
jgi:hypothetical protein